ARQDQSLALPVEPVSRAEPLRLSFAQERLWFLDQLEGPSATYTIPGGLELQGVLDVGALQRSLAAIVGRHEVLRTTFPTEDGVAVQRIAAADTLALPMVDLTELSGPAGEAELRRLAAEEARRPFDLARGPLLRGCLVRLGETRHGLLVTMHHIITDRWSMEILVRELSALYQAEATDRRA